ncbi:MAG TPA: hypothetical protein VF266_08675 [Thermoanaerobaculia bacterium]
MRLAIAAALLWLLAAPVRREPEVIPWAWERREDLRFVGEGKPVAWYAGIITLDGARVRVEPRRNPLQLAPNAHRIAVIRIETRKPTLDERQLHATLKAIGKLHRNAEELQLDFDATRGERAFYTRLLHRVHAERLSITALTSWCFDDRWLGDLPIDEAVPMFFRMGADERVIHARLKRGEEIPEPRCRMSAGISLDEPLPRMPAAQRIWIFNPARWTEETWTLAQQRAR